MNFDWELLRKQKLWLIKQSNRDIPGDVEHCDGLIHLIDAIQDFAVDCDLIPEEEVFGKEME